MTGYGIIIFIVRRLWILLKLVLFKLNVKKTVLKNSAKAEVTFQSNKRSKNSLNAEAVVRRCSVKKMFLNNLQNSQKTTSAGVSF